jgi:hypothetical protein
MDMQMIIDKLIDSLTNNKALEDIFDSLNKAETNWNDLNVFIEKSYIDYDTDLLYKLNFLLNLIYQKFTTVPEFNCIHLSNTYEKSYSLFRLRILLENHLINHLEELVSKDIPENYKNENDFPSWLNQFVSSHPVAHHKAYFEYLSNIATKEDIRFYLLQESTIDANTDDFLASLLIGAMEQPKLEITANLWDEMGEGDINLLHSKLFTLALEQFEIDEIEINNSLTLESLLCGNLQTMLAMRREFFYYGIGYFAATEQLVSDRFIALKNGWDRLNLPEIGAKYHMLHIEVDCHHTKRWYKEVVTPIVDSFSDSKEHILKGALFRLYTSQIYLDRLYNHFNEHVL